MNHSKNLSVICCFLLFFSCNEEQKVTFSDVNITTENNSIVEVNIPEAAGDTKAANQINFEIEQSIISTLHIGNRDDITANSIKESILSFNAEYNAFKQNFPETAVIWEAQIDGEVMYQSSEIISIALTTYTNTGGAAGILNISFLNFDSESGKRLENKAIIKNQRDFKVIAERYFKDAMEDTSQLIDHVKFNLPENIGYSEDGIILLYNSHEISSYANDILEFAIPYEEVEELLTYNVL
jgi:hypothetical protein